MGLDIKHFKATLHNPENIRHSLWDICVAGECGYVLEEDMKEFNVPFSYFHRYIQDVECPGTINGYIIPKKPWQKKDIEGYFLTQKKGFQGTPEKAVSELIALDKPGNKLFEPDCEYIIRDDTSLFVNDGNLLKQQLEDAGYYTNIYENEAWWEVQYAEWVKKKGFYGEGVGYQRKGMSIEFWDRFCTNSKVTNYARPEDFTFAYECVDDDLWGPEKKPAFKQNFLDTYEQGASFMNVSY